MQTTGKEQIGLYFHVPFCTKKCHYCHFYVIPDNPSAHKTLLEGFFLELESWRSAFENCQLATLYFGGGTPSLLDAESFDQLLRKIASLLPFSPKDVEITLEVNPESLSLEKAVQLANLGINRLSIGVQTLDDTLLSKLGRTHHAKKALKAIEIASKSGFSNVSIDLMYEIPGQTIRSWENSLGQLFSLPITHLSLYNLTIEPGTLFFKQRNTLLKEVPEEELCTEMYQTAVDKLHSYGLQQYEISAFARPGYHAKHNSAYWTGKPFAGIGPSAFSYWKGTRFRNKANLHSYWKALASGASPVDFSEQLEPNKRVRELFAIGLRLLSGIDKDLFTKQHGPLDQEIEISLEKLLQGGFLFKEGPCIRLTKKGILFYDTVATELV